MSCERCIGLLAGLLCVAGPVHGAAPSIELPEHGVVAFLGDSVTWHNHYLSWLELRVRQQGRGELQFVNLGVRGDTATAVRRRLKRDLVPRKPVLVFIMLGINDGGLAGMSGRLLDRYGREMSRLVSAIRQQTKARIVLLSPTPVDPVVPGMAEYNEMLQRMTVRLSGIAAQYRVPMIDVFTPLHTAISRSPEVGVPLMADALHPNEAGHLVVAATILERLAGMSSDGGQRISVSAEVCAGGSEEIVFDTSRADRWFPPSYAAVLRSAGNTAFGTQRVHFDGARCGLWLRVPGRVISVGKKLRQYDMPALERLPWAKVMSRAREVLRLRWQYTYALWDPEQRGTAAALADVGGAAQPGTVELRTWMQNTLVELNREFGALDIAGVGGTVMHPGLLSGRPIAQ